MHDLVICDDETTIRNGIKALVESGSDQFRVVGLASNGFEAFRLISELKPDLVLMDINMPGQTGLEVMEKTRTVSAQTRFIIISGHDEFDFVRKALQLNAFDYLLKPLDRHKLLEILAKASQSILADRITAAGEVAIPTGNLGEAALNLIFTKYADPELSLAAAAQTLHISESYLTRAFKKHASLSFSDMLTKVRMETAMQLLTQQKMSCQAVSEAVGYKNQHYFSKVFKAYTGLRPSDYKTR